jgi:hypothetical protein
MITKIMPYVCRRRPAPTAVLLQRDVTDRIIVTSELAFQFHFSLLLYICTHRMCTASKQISDESCCVPTRTIAHTPTHRHTRTHCHTFYITVLQNCGTFVIGHGLDEALFFSQPAEEISKVKQNVRKLPSVGTQQQCRR